MYVLARSRASVDCRCPVEEFMYGQPLHQCHRRVQEAPVVAIESLGTLPSRRASCPFGTGSATALPPLPGLPVPGSTSPRRAACVCISKRKSSRLIHSGDIKLGRAPLSLNHILITTSHPTPSNATPLPIIHPFHPTSTSTSR